MSSYAYQRINDEPHSDSEAIGIQLNPQSATGNKKKALFVPRRYHDTLETIQHSPMKAIHINHGEDDDVVYNTHDEFGEGYIGNIANMAKLVRTGRQRKKQASRAKGSEFQTRRKKRRVYFCCISSEIDIQKLYDYMAGTDSKHGSNTSLNNLSSDAETLESHEELFKEWRLKLHNDVVHLYKGGPVDSETPRNATNKVTLSNRPDNDDQKKGATDDEAMNESANEGYDKFNSSTIGFRSRSAFSSDVGYDVPEPGIFRKQDSLDDQSAYEPIDTPLDRPHDDDTKKVRSNKILVENSFYDSTWKLSLPKVQEVFVFDFGAVVFWGFARGEERKFLNVFKLFSTRGFVGESEFDRSEDDMGFVISPDVEGITIANEVFTLPEDVSPKQRLSVSFAIAQSSVLAIFEARIERLIEDYKYIPESMAADGKARLSERQLGTMIGEVFVIRHDVNLHSEILDTPDFFWKQEDIEKDYKMVMNYLEMGARTEVLNKRLDMLRELLDVLQQQMENAHAVKLEWIVIWLIVIEVILQLIAVANEAGWWLY